MTAGLQALPSALRSFRLAQSASIAETRGGKCRYSLDEAQGVECPTMQPWFNAV